jgi:hypothetical protein
VTTVAGISADVTSVAGNATDISAVADIDADVSTVAGIAADISLVASDSVDIATVAADIAKVIEVANDLQETTSEIDTVANNIADVNTVGTNIADVSTVAGISADVSTVADNVTDIYNYADTYQGAKSSAPSLRNDGSALQAGDLYFNTSDNQMKVYDGAAWGSVGSTVNGTSERFRYIATSGQTTFTGADSNGNTLAYDAGFIDVYLNGVRLDQSDYTASSGDSIVLASGASTNDELNIVAYGNFELADVYTKSASDARYPLKSNNLSDLASASTARTNLGLGTLATVSPTGTASSSTYLRGDSSWAEIQAGFTGGETTTSAVDVTLTSSSAQSQKITITAADKRVILPDATTMQKGGIAFYLGNDAGYTFSVVTSTGLPIAQVSIYASIALMLIDNSTADGVWLPITGWTKYALVTQDTTNVLSGGSVVSVPCMISDTAGVVGYRKSTGLAFVRAFTFNPTTYAFTWGTEVQVDATASTQTINSIFRLTDTTFFAGYTDSDNYKVMGVVGTLSGASITLGGLATFVDLNSPFVFNTSQTFTKVDSTTVTALWDSYNTSTGVVSIQTSSATISGTSISVGNVVSQTTASVYRGDGAIMALGSTLVLIGDNSGTALLWTLSGNTSSSFTETTGLENDAAVNPVKVSATSFFVQKKSGGSVYLYTISGTTVLQTTLSNTGSTSVLLGYVENTYIRNTGAVFPYAPNGVTSATIESLGKTLRSNTSSSAAPEFQLSTNRYLAFTTSIDSFTSAYVVLYRVL